jgi:prepilin-type N-terminal cleavage/methylation domain-containing protein
VNSKRAFTLIELLVVIAMQAVKRLINEEQESPDVAGDAKAVRRIRVECGLMILACSSQ